MKYLLYIALTAVIFIVIKKIFTKKISVKMENDTDLQDAFNRIKQKYGNQLANILEKQFRFETAHFKSTGWKYTKGAGALGSDKKSNFGWGSPNALNYGVKSTWKWKAPNGKTYEYLVFPSYYDGLRFAADYLLSKKDIDTGLKMWSGSAYDFNKLQQITTKYT